MSFMRLEFIHRLVNYILALLFVCLQVIVIVVYNLFALFIAVFFLYQQQAGVEVIKIIRR